MKKVPTALKMLLPMAFLMIFVTFSYKPEGVMAYFWLAILLAPTGWGLFGRAGVIQYWNCQHYSIRRFVIGLSLAMTLTCLFAIVLWPQSFLPLSTGRTLGDYKFVSEVILWVEKIAVCSFIHIYMLLSARLLDWSVKYIPRFRGNACLSSI